MKAKRPDILWLAVFVVAWCFDQLFWQKSPGISLPIFTFLMVGTGLLLAWLEKRMPVRITWLLLIPLVFFAIMFSVRLEIMSRFLSIMMTLGLLILLALTFRSGTWPDYSLLDYVAGLFVLGAGAVSHPLSFLLGNRKTNDPAAAPPAAAGEGGAGALPVRQPSIFQRAYILPVIRGLLLALPILAVLTALLSSADPIFADQVKNIFRWFDLSKLTEYIFRGVYISLFAYLILGVYLHAYFHSQETRLIGKNVPWMSAFLGWTESTVIMGSIDLLFLIFVVIQFRYFFGGSANVNTTGYTYAEYARRGFSELVSVAVISLLVFLGLNTITRRTTQAQSRLFSILGTILVGLVIVILISAFQRLLLYEEAYGFSAVRTYTHVFIIWLGLLLLATVVLEWLHRSRAFALAALIACLGFAATLNLMNVDAFIARQNVYRTIPGSELDVSYLEGLSTDATPTLAAFLQDSRLSADTRAQIGGVLACERAAAASLTNPGAQVWSSYNFSQGAAQAAFAKIDSALQAYPISTGERGELQVTVNQKTRPCNIYRSMD
jgi:hypothetical protein